MKIEAMQTQPSPKIITELRGFFGLTGYDREFVKNYGVIASPLIHLLKKGQFEWSPQALDDFIALKHAMATMPILGIPNFFKPFVLETDASEKGMGDLWPTWARLLGHTKRG